MLPVALQRWSWLITNVPHGADLESLGLRPSIGLDDQVPAVEIHSVAAPRSAIKFKRDEENDEKIAELCTFVRNRDPSRVRVKLIADSHGLFQEGVELPGDPNISLQAPSVSLAKVLPSASMRADEQRRLFLSYLLAKAVWKFYDVDWMAEDWTKDAVHFMRHHLDDLQKPRAQLSHKPFILAKLRSSTSRASMPRETAAKRNSGRTHILPKVLALGIVLLEIELGRSVVVPGDQNTANMSDQQRANAAHFAASTFLLSDKWNTRRNKVYLRLAEAIEICVKPDTSRLDPERARHSLYEAVVRPLADLFSTMWLPAGQQPEMFSPGPIKLDETEDLFQFEFNGPQGAEYSQVPLPSTGPLHPISPAEETENDENDIALCGAGDSHDKPTDP